MVKLDHKQFPKDTVLLIYNRTDFFEFEIKRYSPSNKFVLMFDKYPSEGRDAQQYKWYSVDDFNAFFDICEVLYVPDEFLR